MAKAKLTEWSDIDSKFTVLSGGNINIVKGTDAIDQSILLLLSTLRGERVRSKLGSGLFNLLFQPMTDDTVDDIKDVIEFNLTKYENRISIRRIDVTANADQNFYRIEISYVVRRTREKKNLTTFMPVMGDI